MFKVSSLFYSQFFASIQLLQQTIISESFNEFCTKLKHLIFAFWYNNEKETGLLKHAKHASNIQNMPNK